MEEENFQVEFDVKYLTFFFFFLDILLIKWYRLLDISQHELLGFSFNQPLKLRSTCLEMGIVEKLGIT